MKKFFRPKSENKTIKGRIIIREPFNHEEQDYFKPVRVGKQ